MAGGVIGGEALAAKLAEFAAKAKDGTVSVGFLENAVYPNGTSVAMVAAIQNFGAPAASIPPRPFFTNMIEKNSPKWGKSMAKVLKATNYDIQQSLGLMGEGMVGQLQTEIINTNEPALSPITLMLRKMFPGDSHYAGGISGKSVGEAARRVAEGEDYGGVSTKPLDFSAHMLKSVDFAVKAS